MASPNQRTGKAWIYINGTLYETASGAKLKSFLGLSREAVTGAEVYGYTEKTVAPGIDGELIHGGTLRLEDLRNVTDATITFKCDTGVTYVLRNAWVKEVGDLDSSQGTISVSFEGKKAEEVSG
jgi:hypothetical protein